MLIAFKILNFQTFEKSKLLKAESLWIQATVFLAVLQVELITLLKIKLRDSTQWILISKRQNANGTIIYIMGFIGRLLKPNVLWT